MDLGLKGLKAIVTGGSRGIGRAIASLFADEGADVAICARTKEGVEEAVKDLETRGSKVLGEAVDVGDGAALKGSRWPGLAPLFATHRYMRTILSNPASQPLAEQLGYVRRGSYEW